jgi:hypothetical protein
MSEYRKIDKGTEILKGVRLLKSLPDNADALYKNINTQLKRGKEIWSAHSRVAIPKEKFDKLKPDFKKAINWVGAIPEPGAKASYRGPGGLHAHEYKNVVVIHKDKTPPDTLLRKIKHGITEGIPTMPKGLFGGKVVKEAEFRGMLNSLTKVAIDDITEAKLLGAATAISAPLAIADVGALGSRVYSPVAEMLSGQKGREESEKLIEKYLGKEFPKQYGKRPAFLFDTVGQVLGVDLKRIPDEKIKEYIKNEMNELKGRLENKIITKDEFLREAKKLDPEVVKARIAYKEFGSMPHKEVLEGKKSLVSVTEVTPRKVFHGNYVPFTAHEIGHALDVENIARNHAIRGKYMNYFATLQNEMRASKKAFDILRETYGTGKAIRSIPGLAAALSTYASGAAPISLKAISIGAPALFAAGLGIKKIMED